MAEPPTSRLTNDRPFELVFVCTGNRARSAFAEAALAGRLGRADVVVRSAGTLDLGAVEALPEAIRAAALLGVDLSAHRARPLSIGLLAETDLVIGFEPHHLTAAVVDASARVERCFSLIELAELLDRNGRELAVDPAGAIEAVGAEAGRRAADLLTAPSIADPLGRSDAFFRRTFETIDELTARIAARLFRTTAALS